MALPLLILTVGVLAAGAALILRAVVPQPWLLVKPWACDLCMSWWSSLVSGALTGSMLGHTAATAAVAAVGGTAVSVLLLKTINRLDDRV